MAHSVCHALQRDAYGEQIETREWRSSRGFQRSRPALAVNRAKERRKLLGSTGVLTSVVNMARSCPELTAPSTTRPAAVRT